MRKSKLKEFIQSPNRSLILISIPIITSAIVETLYLIVDAVFVGRLGSEALAAITFAWPFFFILTALSLGLNAGIASRISRYLGEKDKKQAENTMLHGLLIALVLSLIIALIGLPSIRLIFTLAGATGNVLNMSAQYMFVILSGIIFMFVSYAITSIFAAQGDTKTAMKIDIYSLIINIVLAPIYIFVFHLGVMGSALATISANFFALIQASYYLHNTSYLHFHPKLFKFSKKITKEILSVGFPSTLMMLVVSLSAIFLNKAMIHFSVDHLAAFGIMSRLESISTLPIYGLSVGAMTLAGMFYGAKKLKLLEKISWYAIKVGILISSIIGIIIFLFPEFFIRWFTSEQAVVDIGIPYIRFYILSIPLSAIGMIIGRIMQGIGKGIPGLIISLIRSLFISIPLAYLFVFILDYSYISIAAAAIIGGIISVAIGIFWLNKEIRVKKQQRF